MWKRTTKAHWDKAREFSLIHAYVDERGFLVGINIDHAECTVTGNVMPRYDALRQKGNRYYMSIRPLTIPEYQAEDGP
jgi:hypothetical protein